MLAECNGKPIVFQAHGRREVTASFDGGRLSSDGGTLLLREADNVFGVTSRLAGCLSDHRDSGRSEHKLDCLVAQRVMAIALGYEDLNDHDQLRDESVLALAVGCDDITSADRVRERDRGHPLASSSTFNRLKLGTPDQAADDRYNKISADSAAIDRLLVALFLEAHGTAPEEIVLDLDATDDPLHGAQEGHHFHAYYDCYCHLPLYVTCGKHVLCCRQRPANIDASDGALDELVRIIAQIREAWPQVRILVRGNSGFCREEIMAWCEANAVDYVFGLARNARLVRKNPRFVVTSLSVREIGARALYEDLYCTRGDMENRIKEQQIGLFADRTSTARSPHRSRRALAGPASAELCLKPLPTADDSVLFSPTGRSQVPKMLSAEHRSTQSPSKAQKRRQIQRATMQSWTW